MHPHPQTIEDIHEGTRINIVRGDMCRVLLEHPRVTGKPSRRTYVFSYQVWLSLLFPPTSSCVSSRCSKISGQRFIHFEQPSTVHSFIYGCRLRKQQRGRQYYQKIPLRSSPKQSFRFYETEIISCRNQVRAAVGWKHEQREKTA